MSWPLALAMLAFQGAAPLPPHQPGEYRAQQVRFRTEVVATGMRLPVAMTFLPDGRALVVEREGAKIHIYDPKRGSFEALVDGFQPVKVQGEAHDPRRPATLTIEDAGLLDIVLHPQYEKNGWIYISYSAGEPERSTTAVDRFRLRGKAIVDRERVFTADAYSEDRFHYGGRMVFQNGYLFLTIGDRHHQDRAQELDKHAGKILRLTDDGKAPPDNPFVGKKVDNVDAKPEIWSYGHRNPQGLVVHPTTGELLSTEHGPLGGDEFNIIRKGANYGWPIISWGFQYDGGPIGMGITKKEGMEAPLWMWSPGIAPSGLIVYTGDKFPAWKGSILGGAMAARHLNRLVMEEGRVVLEERILNRKAGRIRLVAQSPDGYIYIGNDDGQLLRLSPVQ
jgi:glucose/arabinose dehydrogenase